ncbi:hypothetical protein KAU92_00680 [Candidatus Bathyarchaeota archaeon]|nr:hypothetical protein [Candidatus Bathyarchaeota archaeon]
MTEEKQMVEDALKHEMIEVHTSLTRTFYEFLKELLAFYGSKETVEDLSRWIIYAYVREQYESIHDHMCKDAVTKAYRLKWFEKWDRIAVTCGPDDEEE